MYEKHFNTAYIMTSMEIVYGQQISIEAPEIGQMVVDNNSVYVYMGQDWVQIS